MVRRHQPQGSYGVALKGPSRRSYLHLALSAAENQREEELRQRGSRDVYTFLDFALLSALHAGISKAEISRHFVASAHMVRFRRGITGVDRQLNAQHPENSCWLTASQPRRHCLEVSVCDIVAPLGRSQPTVSHHSGNAPPSGTSCYCFATEIDGRTSSQPNGLDGGPDLTWSDVIRPTGWTI